MTTALVQRAGGVVNVAIPTDAKDLGKLLAESGFFTDARGAAQAAVKVMAGAELGFGPIASMTGVHIVKGRVTLSANLMAAAVKRHPAYTYRLKEHTPDACEIEFIENGQPAGTSRFTMDDARKAGLAGSDTYKKHPRNMLFARAMSNGAKWFCPDVFGGPIYTPDELGAVVDGETGEVVDAAAVDEPAQETIDRPTYDRIVEKFHASRKQPEDLAYWLCCHKNDIGPAVAKLTPEKAAELEGWLA